MSTSIPQPAKVMAFRVEGMDCAEEVTILKRELGPLVGGDDALGFDILQRKLNITPPTSDVTPSAILKADYGLVAEQDYEPVFSGKHDNSVLGVANKDYDAAAIANSVMRRMFERGVVDREKIVSIYKSQTFPTTGYGHVYNLKPEVAEKVKEAFFSFPWEGSELKKEFKKEDKFAPISYKEHWEVIRKIDKASGVSYACK